MTPSFFTSLAGKKQGVSALVTHIASRESWRWIVTYRAHYGLISSTGIWTAVVFIGQQEGWR